MRRYSCRRDSRLLDTTLLSVGLETAGSVVTMHMEHNTSIPTKNGQTFTTNTDSQPGVHT